MLTDHERAQAIKEGECNDASDAYFSARAGWEHIQKHALFDAAFSRGWDAATAPLLARIAELGAAPPEQAEAKRTLRQELQKQCSAWGCYWRASDSHGVELTKEQAEELLVSALGVEVEITGSEQARASEPLTPEQVAVGCVEMGCDDGQEEEAGFFTGVRWAERAHNIGVTK